MREFNRNQLFVGLRSVRQRRRQMLGKLKQKSESQRATVGPFKAIGGGTAQLGNPSNDPDGFALILRQMEQSMDPERVFNTSPVAVVR